MGRPRKTGRKKGYWYRAGRGWFITTEGGRLVPLRFPGTEKHIKDQRTDVAVLDDAYRAYVLASKAAEEEAEYLGVTSRKTVLDLYHAYRQFTKGHNRANTQRLRGFAVFDFTFGLSGTWIDKFQGAPSAEELASINAKLRRKLAAKLAAQAEATGEVPREPTEIHDGYAHHFAETNTWADMDQWLGKHPTWNAGGNKQRRGEGGGNQAGYQL